MLDLHAARDVAVRAARTAAALIRDAAGAPEAVRAKGTNDLVTATDEAAQDAIAGVLTGAFPDVPILGEEGTDPDAVAPAPGGPRWIVDPIDGTTNFAHAAPPYAVSIALQDGDAVVAGVVLDVARDELFTAVRGQGLHVDGARHAVSAADALGDVLVATGFPYRHYAHLDRFLATLRRVLLHTRDVRRHGSAAIDLAWTACGRFGGFFETGLHPWDVAAGSLLVREGGGRVTDFGGAGGLAPVFARQICATNGPLHDALLALLPELRDVRL